MSGPPTNISAEDLWAKLQELPRPSKVVDFPRLGPDGKPIGRIAIWVLTQLEQLAADKEAEDFAKKQLKEGKRDDLGYDRIFTDALMASVLVRACRDPENLNRPIFPGMIAMADKLTTDEAALLFEHYLTVQMELSPVQRRLSDGELDAWIDRLVEGGSAFPFSLMSSELQKLLLLHMAFQLRPSQKGTSSATESLESNTSSSSAS